MNILKKMRLSLWTSLLVSGLISACAASGEPSTDTETSSIATCCSSGGYTCPTNSTISFDYDPPGCGAYTKPKAQSMCESLCSTTCRDSGWLPSC